MNLFDTKILLLPLHFHPSVTVKYCVRVLYTCCDVTQTWFKYLRSWAMDSPTSLLLGYYTLLSYSYHTLPFRVTMSVNVLTTGSCAKTEKKNNFSFFFPKPTFFFNPWQRVAQNTFFVWCLLYRDKGHDKNTGSRLRKHLSSKGIPFQSENPFSLTASGARPILVSEMGG